ncbi:MAG TPA: ribosome silencing factor [Syntrophomonadaceae bacterium]|nr:ribosome silencing factor [Syntrophomonadaceae bacterium]HPU48195.1 ribosome silencing factor [Syntrophomonadaceae bacterium]
MNQEEKLARMIADACLEEKALDVMVLDVRKLTVITDYFVIASGRSMIQVRSIVDHVLEKLQEQGINPVRKEGIQQGVWAVLDFNSVILHVFRQEEREYYQLENLWADAPQLLVDSSI